jgi:DNA-directed RNA polymerase subunit RPC12/RpoP
MTVVDLESRRPHLSGPCRCLHCKHEFVCVRPVGAHDLECPKCGLRKAVGASLALPEDGTVWVCNCGNWFFLILPDGSALCPNCGERRRDGT